MELLIKSLVILTFIGPSLEQTGNDAGMRFLTSLLKPGLLFDGPSSVVNAPRITANTALDLEELFYFNYVAGACYCTDQLADMSCGPCQKFKDDISYKVVLSNDTTSAAALIITQPIRQQIVIAFRGSSSLPDLILDQIFVNVDEGQNIKIHKGFYICTVSLYYQVVREIQEQLLLHPTFRIVLTGHSLGASMATITQFFFKYLNQFPAVPSVLVTYAQPRVGNIGYANFMNAQPMPMVRVVNRADVIPHVTPVSAFGSNATFDYYVHHQTEYWTNNNTGYWGYCDDSVYEDPNCSNSLGPAYSIVDHGPYFDVNHAVCVFGNAYSLLTIPWVLNPDYLPEALPILPRLVSPLIRNVTELVGPIIIPILG